MSSCAIYVLSRSALDLSRALGRELGADVFGPSRFAESGMTGFDSLPAQVGRNFTRYSGHVFIAAAGIAVRAIAPHLRSKGVDPAVVAMDPQGANVISLLSGHLGGANQLARQCAAITGGRAIITTATDCAGVPSLDMLARERGLRIGDPDAIKDVNAALLEGRTVQVFDPLGCLGPLDPSLFTMLDTPDQWQEDRPGVRVHWTVSPKRPGQVRLYAPVLCVGMGCRRGTPASEIREFVERVLTENGLAVESVAAAGTADIKKDEAGLLLAAQELGLPLTFFDADTLKTVDAPNPSAMVESHVGTPGVSEAAALLLCEGGELLVAKQKTSRVTVAVAGRTKCSQP